MSLNKAQIIGNLGADPETRSSQGGMTICNLRIATNERKKDGDSWVEHTEWHRVVCFDKLAENCAKHLSKGRQVYVEGKIRTNKWTDKDGVERFTTEILADDVRFLGAAPERDERDDRRGGRDRDDRGSGRGRDDDRGGRDRDDRSRNGGGSASRGDY
jgi:single-strand DNA-binding protein